MSNSLLLVKLSVFLFLLHSVFQKIFFIKSHRQIIFLSCMRVRRHRASVSLELAVWNIVELLSFGNFMELYELYYQTYPSFNYSDYLKSIKFIRNAAAHNNCILSTLRKPNSLKKFNKTKKLANILGKIPEFKELNSRDAMMRNPVIHDFVTLLFVYNDVMKVSATQNARNKKMEEICHLFCDEDGRIRKNAVYFEKNPYIKETYSFICNIIKYINKKNKNPKHTNFLQ